MAQHRQHRGFFLDWTGVTVCSNDIVSKATGNPTTWAVSVALMLNSPQTAVWAWHDYNPQAPGSGQIVIAFSSVRASLDSLMVWAHGSGGGIVDRRVFGFGVLVSAIGVIALTLSMNVRRGNSAEHESGERD